MDTDFDIERPPRTRPWPRLLWLTLGVVVVAGIGAGYWLVTQDGAAEAAGASASPVATARVTRQSISDTRSFRGTLGHGAATTVTTSRQGVVTRVADQGSLVERGGELYRLNEQPVTVMYGAIPMYRDLRQGDVGVDVEQLNTDLTELGHGDCGGNEFTGCTEAAVRAWQSAIATAETGVVAQSDVVFLSAGGRVDTVHVAVGRTVAPGSPVLAVTGSDQVASVDVDVRDRHLLAMGAVVRVRVPGGGQVAGTVTAANVVPAGSPGGTSGGDAGGTADTVAKVDVTLDERVDESFLGVPVDVVVEVDERSDVLTVPVNALLALSGGGHGVEVVAGDGTTSILPVDTGLFAGGWVEVEADGIAAGTVVVVAGR